MTCQGCEKRKVGCHSQCEDYMTEWRARREQGEKRILQNAVDSLNVEGSCRARKKKAVQRLWGNGGR